jgi:hypothetical protein
MGSRGEIVIRGVRLQNTSFDYPITINSRVEYWVDYFTGRGRKHFARYLERSELFIPYIVPLLRQNGMPEDLVYLAMIESGFNNHARSWAKAVGPWQFIPATGRRYGLTVNWWVDERRDTHKSTLGAIGYLRDLYSLFNSWELAAAAYNAGEAKIARGIRRYGTKDFWVLSRQRFLRPETRDYVPKIIAAALIAKNRHQFGFAPSAIQPSDGEAISPGGEIVKLVKNGDPDEAAAEDAESELREVLSASGGASPFDDYENAADFSGVPSEESELADSRSGSSRAGQRAGRRVGQREEQEEVEAGEPDSTNPLPGVLAGAEEIPLARPIATPKVSKTGELTGEILAEFEVQGPADLLKIARAAGLSYQTVKALNPELLRWCTPPSLATYRIKLPVSAKEQFLSAYNDPSFQRRVQFLTHSARRGESLASIARRYGIRVDALTEMNRVAPRKPLRVNSLVVLPLPNDRSRTLASLEVLDPPEVRKRSRRSRYGKSKFYKVSYKRREAARAARSARGKNRGGT